MARRSAHRPVPYHRQIHRQNGDDIQLYEANNHFNFEVAVNCDITQFLTNPQYCQQAIQRLDQAIARERKRRLNTNFTTKKRKGPDDNDKGGRGGGLGGCASTSLGNLVNKNKLVKA